MRKHDFIEQAASLIERVQQSALGICDHLGEKTPEDAAEEIAELLPDFAFDS